MCLFSETIPWYCYQFAILQNCMWDSTCKRVPKTQFFLLRILYVMLLFSSRRLKRKASVQVRTLSYSVFKTKTDQPKANAFSACWCRGWGATGRGRSCVGSAGAGLQLNCSSSTNVAGRVEAAEELLQAAVWGACVLWAQSRTSRDTWCWESSGALSFSHPSDRRDQDTWQFLALNTFYLPDSAASPSCISVNGSLHVLTVYCQCWLPREVMNRKWFKHVNAL